MFIFWKYSTYLYCWFTTNNTLKNIYGIFFSFLEIYDYSIIKLNTISLFLDDYSPLCITCLRKTNVYVLKILHVGILLVYHTKTIKHQNMAYSLHFRRYMTTSSSNWTQYLSLWKTIYLIISLVYEKCVLCFRNTLHGCIVGLPQIKHQNPKYGIFSPFLEIYVYSIIKLYPLTIFS